jgi:hypothetical protein
MIHTFLTPRQLRSLATNFGIESTKIIMSVSPKRSQYRDLTLEVIE